MLIGLEIGLVGRPVQGHDPWHDRRRHQIGDLRLDRENVLETAVEGLAPSLYARIVHELGRDPELVAGLTDAALQQIAHAEQAADLRDPVVAVLESERRGAADDVQIAELGELVQDLFRNPVAEGLVFGVVADVGKRQDGNRVLGLSLCLFCIGLRIRRFRHTRRLEDLGHRLVQDQRRDQRQRPEHQVVVALKRKQIAGIALFRGRCPHDAAGGDVVEPSKDQRERKSQDRGDEQNVESRIRQPPGWEENIRRLHHQPRPDDVEPGRAENAPSPHFAQENERSRGVFTHGLTVFRYRAAGGPRRSPRARSRTDCDQATHRGG